MSELLTINIAASASAKFQVEISPDATVLELKSAISLKGDMVPPENQRLIYSGKVLKDESLLSSYKIVSLNTVHMVKGTKPAPIAASAQVPANFNAGQQVMGNPLAPLTNALNAGQVGSFNPFVGHNTNNPDLMRSMMADPATQANVANMLNDPAVLDQLIASNPQLAASGPQVRQLMQSEQFRNFLTNPEAMANMRQMMAANPDMMNQMQQMGGMGGMGAPPAAAQGQIPDFASLFGGMGGAGGMGGFAAPAVPVGPVVPPEERFQEQLAQLSGMGFYDVAKNIRCLMATGGNVQAAIEYMFSLP